MSETKKQIIIIRVFNAPASLVWRAWTDPELAKKWWGPKEFTAPSIKIDLRVGGKYIFAMHGPAGSEWDKDMYSAGEYIEINPYKKLVVTDYFSDEYGEMMKPSEQGQDASFPSIMTVTVLFEEMEGGKTKLSVVYPEPETQEQYEAMMKSGMNEGWSTSLDKLAKAVES